MSLVKVMESAPVRGLQSLSAAVQSPYFTGPLLAALLYAPDNIKQQVLQHLPASFNMDVAQKVLQVLLGLGALKALNQGLSSMAANSWRVAAAKGWDWPREIAVVTGGCSGIGYCIVKRLVARKVKVAILDIQSLPQDFAANPLVRFYKCDITSPESVAKAADAVRKDLGHPSILINNAGITRPLPILEMPQDFLQKIFDVNCLSHWTLVQQFLPNMIKVNKGHVMTIASLASFIALPKGADYSATKAAALSFHESLAIELKHIYKADSVLTSVAHPNFVRTPLVKDFGSQLEQGGIRRRHHHGPNLQEARRAAHHPREAVCHFWHSWLAHVAAGHFARPARC
jgi:NAD(P)-dependent dehydrogenase (short-subunit alcohol dehydrogenase family)